MLAKLFFVLISLTCLSTSLAIKRSFDVELYNTTCKPYSDLMMKTACDMTKLAVGRYVLNVMFELNRQLPSTTELKVLIHVRADQSRTAVKFLELKLNICDMMKQARATPLIKDIVEKVAKSSNKPLVCPIKGNSMYNISNFIVTNDLFPVNTPALNFNFTMNFFEKKKLLVVYQLQGSTVRKS